MTDELPFKVVRSNGTDEVLARAMNLPIARGAWMGRELAGEIEWATQARRRGMAPRAAGLSGMPR
jgi:hypothetical protein